MSPACAHPPADSAAEARAAVSQPDGKSWWPSAVAWSAWGALALYTLLLFLRAQARQNIVPAGHEITLGDLMAIRQWLYETLWGNLQMGFCMLLFGFLVAIGFGSGRSQGTLRAHPNTTKGVSHGRRMTAPAIVLGSALRMLGQWFLMALLGGGAFLFLFLIETGRLPGLLGSLAPITGFLLGAWAGRSALDGPRAMLWLVPKVFALFAAGMAGLAALGFLATAPDPLPIEMPKVTSAEKRRLVEILKHPRPLADGTRLWRLGDGDLNLILAMGTAQVVPGARGRITLDEGTVTAELSAPLTGTNAPGCYVNVRASGKAEIAEGRLRIDFRKCRIGRVPVPAFVLHRLVRQAIVVVRNDRDLNNLFEAIGSLRVAGDRVEAVVVSRGLFDNVVASLAARFGQGPNVVAKTRIYYQHLARPLPGVADDDRFAWLVQSSFSLARRSETESPALENRAAIFALAILLGHRRLEHLVGPVSDDELRHEARRHVSFVRLRGRTDWSRHFLVSSALALLSNEMLSDEAGLFKEELDAGEGGSGFSFSDLLADRAGTLFALAATRDDQSARRMQNLLAEGFDIGVIFPEAADLPEGIPDDRLQAEYGGVGGEKYRVMIDEIQRRLDECEGLATGAGDAEQRPSPLMTPGPR